MLESRPPDRKLDTGTSATRCAATDSSITAPRSRGPLRGFPCHVRDPPVVLQVSTAIRAEARPRAAGQLPYACHGAPILRHPEIEHRRDHGARLDPQFGAYRRDQRLQLRGEDHSLASREVVERLDAERVTRQEEITARLVGQREREHATEPAQGLGPPAPPGLEHDLGI